MAAHVPAKSVLALTMGDPAGIGPDITLSAWLLRRQTNLSPFALLGDVGVLNARARLLGLQVPIREIGALSEAVDVFGDALPVQSIALPAPVTAGTPDSVNAAAVVASITRAVDAVLSGEAAAVVTNPIAKSVLYAAGFPHPGHTEFLGALAALHFPGRRFTPVMMLASDELKAVPLTVHVPYSAVPALITRQLIFETVRITHAALEQDFGIAHPRIAVTGLNPHAGEDGTMGREETLTITPAIRALAAEGLSVSGPYPADTLFHAAARKTYDAAIAMYHDQALIPLKTLAFDRGVNITLGLPFIRTSPDHGTAFGIAGSGAAKPDSLIEALKMAGLMSAHRAAQRSGQIGTAV